jgi:hypothetical protein
VPRHLFRDGVSEDLTESQEPGPDPGLGCPKGHVKALGDLDVGQAGEERELHGGPLDLAQLAHRGADLVSTDAEPHRVVNVVRRRLELKVRVGMPLARQDLAPDGVDRLVAGHRVEPRPDGSLRGVEARRVLPDRDEDLLDDVLGEPVAAGDLHGERIERAAVAAMELLDGALVAGDDSPEEDRLLVTLVELLRGRLAHASSAPCSDPPWAPS